MLVLEGGATEISVNWPIAAILFVTSATTVSLLAPAAAIRAPSRTAFWLLMETYKARPKSVNPPTTISIMGNINRSEEHTSELQSPCNLVCRLLLEKKKKEFMMRSPYKL